MLKVFILQIVVCCVCVFGKCPTLHQARRIAWYIFFFHEMVRGIPTFGHRASSYCKCTVNGLKIAVGRYLVVL